MPRDVIPFPLAKAKAAPAWDALQEFRALAATLAGAVAFRDACRARERRGPWRVPPLFFFHKHPQDTPHSHAKLTDVHGLAVARRRPAEARAWADLRPRLLEACDRLTASAHARHIARAVPGLRAHAESLAADRADCADLAGMLRVADDLIVNAVHPESGTAFRTRLRGVADLAQFHVLLSDVVGFELPGAPPDERLVEAYRNGPADPACDVATARFQFWHPDAWQNDRFPPAFRGSEWWFWGHESPLALPMVGGERTLFLGAPAYPRQWAAERKAPQLCGDVELLARSGIQGRRQAA